MDPAGVGVLLGIGVMITLCGGVYMCERTKNKVQRETTNPLLIRRRSSFKVKNLFSHVHI
jgi:hypothetical protein